MNDNYVYVRIGKGLKRHIMRRVQFDACFEFGSGWGYAICGMGGELFEDDSDTAVCAACLKKLERMKT